MTSAQIVGRELTPDSLSVTVIYAPGSSIPNQKDSTTVGSIAAFKAAFEDLINNNDVYIDSLTVYGKTSPEGSLQLNQRLGKARAARFTDMFGLDSLKNTQKIRVKTYMLKWEALIPLIQGSGWEFEEQILLIISDNALSEMQKERKVRALGAKAWKELNEKFMNGLRSSEINVYFQYQALIYNVDEYDLDLDEIELLLLDEQEIEMEPLFVEVMKIPLVRNKDVKARIAIKMNGLEALAGITNIGTEIGFDHWSLDIPGTYSPYTIAKTYKAKLFAIQPEIRYWFGDYTMTKGHFIGLHTHVAGFNVHAGNGRRYQDPNRAVWGLGLSYGYALPLKAGTGWTMEFNIGAGYANIKYDVYENGKDGWFLYTDKLNYWGLTRLGVTVSYRFDIKK